MNQKCMSNFKLKSIPLCVYRPVGMSGRIIISRLFKLTENDIHKLCK